MTKKKQRETNLWQFDPSLFQHGPREGLLKRHVINHARSVGKYTLFALPFAYPLILVTIGIVFGGLVFWTSFAGSVVLIWLIIKKTGYARNFANWDIGYKKFVGLIGAFGMSLAFVYGLAYTPLRVMTIPVMGLVLLVILILGVWRTRNR